MMMMMMMSDENIPRIRLSSSMCDLYIQLRLNKMMNNDEWMNDPKFPQYRPDVYIMKIVEALSRLLPPKDY